jgi:exodeoxyribonuclease VII large subunit
MLDQTSCINGFSSMFEGVPAGKGAAIWTVGALCRAIGDQLQARFNPVMVQGEVSGFTQAASGHCYFSLKDDGGQLRCAMFKRSAAGLLFNPKDGDTVEAQGRLTVYEPRGDLQLVVEGMRLAGQGQLFEQFLRLKARLEADGLFDPGRKRALPLMPRTIGLVTSLQAAALQDVLTTLQRRAPHIPVLLAPASVQGAQAPQELIAALDTLYALACPLVPKKSKPGEGAGAGAPVDVIMIVRGGGSLDDLWAFNDEQLVRKLAQSPVPVLAGVGHETDFTLVDFVADVRAPTPTAAAELVAQPRQSCLEELEGLAQRLDNAVQRFLDRQAQGLDGVQQRLGRPSQRLADQRLRLSELGHRQQAAWRHMGLQQAQRLAQVAQGLPQALGRALELQRNRLEHGALRLSLLDPRLVLERGYAWLSDEQGQAVSRVAQTQTGQRLQATLVDGTLDLTVSPKSP